jgi:hypothetical protein
MFLIVGLDLFDEVQGLSCICATPTLGVVTVMDPATSKVQKMFDCERLSNAVTAFDFYDHGPPLLTCPE